MSFKISVDSGGTFTDGVLTDETGKVWAGKAHTTPADLTVGTIACFTRLATLAGLTLEDMLAQTGMIVHGTTLATNIVATHSGARLGTICTQGYRDRMSFLHVAKADLKGEIREAEADLFDFRLDYPQQLTARRLTVDVEERLDYQGKVLVPLSEDSVRKAVAYLRQQDVESIAVLCLFSQLNPAHERRIGEIVREDFPEAYVALSHEVLPVWGEVARWSTTMFSAYVAPRVIRYVSSIERLLQERGFSGQLVFMQSNGGVATSDIVMESPATLLISGPAAGPSMAVELGRQHGARDLLSVDMGGTSFDVAVVPEANVAVVQKKVVEGKRFALPSVDVNAIGAGGGSIAWLDPSGRLQVGPKSAGASPGPACYGAGGTEPTVTDANVVLGYIDPDFFLGGETELRKDLAEQAIAERIGDPLGLSPAHAAAAIHDVVNAKMAGAINVVFTRRGYDPREFALVCAGGAGPVHGARLMQELGIRHFVAPKVAPVYCASGMMYADLKHNFTRPYHAHSDQVDLARMNALYAEMEAQAVEILGREGVARKEMLIEKTADLRYYGQVREQNARVPEGPVTEEAFAVVQQHFHDRHRTVIGYADEGYPTEIVRLHLTGTARALPPISQTIESGGPDVESDAVKGDRPVFFGEHGDFVDVRIYDGGRLLAGNRLDGPCIVEEAMTTVVIPPDLTLTVDRFGNYTTLNGEGPSR